MMERLGTVFIDGRLPSHVVGAGVMTGPILNMGCETRNDADCRLVGMVFCLGFFEGTLFTCDLRHVLSNMELCFSLFLKIQE